MLFLTPWRGAHGPIAACPRYHNGLGSERDLGHRIGTFEEGQSAAWRSRATDRLNATLGLPCFENPARRAASTRVCNASLPTWILGSTISKGASALSTSRTCLHKFRAFRASCTVQKATVNPNRGSLLSPKTFAENLTNSPRSESPTRSGATPSPRRLVRDRGVSGGSDCCIRTRATRDKQVL